MPRSWAKILSNSYLSTKNSCSKFSSRSKRVSRTRVWDVRLEYRAHRLSSFSNRRLARRRCLSCNNFQSSKFSRLSCRFQTPWLRSWLLRTLSNSRAIVPTTCQSDHRHLPAAVSLASVAQPSSTQRRVLQPSPPLLITPRLLEELPVNYSN